MINKIILLGNVGADPEIRTLESGVKTARIRVATTENILDKTTNTWEQRTEWHTVILWRNLADTADKHIRKGCKVYVDGVMHYRNYTDKNGAEKMSAEITANELKIVIKVAPENTATEPNFTPPQYPAPQSPIPTAMPEAAPTGNTASPGPMPVDDDLLF